MPSIKKNKKNSEQIAIFNIYNFLSSDCPNASNSKIIKTNCADASNSKNIELQNVWVHIIPIPPIRKISKQFFLDAFNSKNIKNLQNKLYQFFMPNCLNF